MDETGLLQTPKTDRVFALGLLKLHHPMHLHRAIIDFKNSKKFHGEFHFTNISGNNWRMYSELLDLFFTIPKCQFYSIVFDKGILDFETFFKGDHIHAYNSFVAKIISEALNKGEYIAIIADDVSTPKGDNFEKQIKKKVKQKAGRNALFGIVRVESHAVSEIQMTDVLLGLVGYAFKIKYGLIPNPSRVKVRLLRSFQEKLNIDFLAKALKKEIKGGGLFKVKEFLSLK